MTRKLWAQRGLMETEDKNVKGNKGDYDKSEVPVIVKMKPEEASNRKPGSKAFWNTMPQEFHYNMVLC